MIPTEVGVGNDIEQVRSFWFHLLVEKPATVQYHFHGKTASNRLFDDSPHFDMIYSAAFHHTQYRMHLTYHQHIGRESKLIFSSHPFSLIVSSVEVLVSELGFGAASC